MSKRWAGYETEAVEWEDIEREDPARKDDRAKEDECAEDDWARDRVHNSRTRPGVSSKRRSGRVLFINNVIAAMIICAFLLKIFLSLQDRW